ncbi:MAG TPA: tetratricopeptide repeat protein [Terriglobales bacterium]|nr:tetratricopeptide repeat protein [Terriglobales bacterium]
MRRIWLTGIILVLAAALWAESASPSSSEVQPLSQMTVAQLETKGDILRAQKDYEQAIQYYDAALHKQPKNSVLYNKIGIAELQIGQVRPAEFHFERAVKLNGKYAQALNNLGVVAYMQKSFGRAVKYYKKSLAVNEQAAAVHGNLGTAWFAQGKLDRAIAEYTRALELDPEVLLRSTQGGVSARISSPEDRAKYSYVLAKLYARRGDIERCLECLRKAKDEGYHKLADVYKDEEFATIRQDARLAALIPLPAVNK